MLMASICLTSIKDEGVEVPDESYEVMNGIDEIISSICHTARTANSTLNEANRLKSKAERLVATAAECIQLLLRLTGVAKFNDAAVKLFIRPNLHCLPEFALFWW